jgi:hypothetical protein
VECIEARPDLPEEEEFGDDAQRGYAAERRERTALQEPIGAIRDVPPNSCQSVVPNIA